MVCHDINHTHRDSSRFITRDPDFYLDYPGLEKGTLSGLPALGLDGESIPGRWIMLDRAPGTPGTPGVPVHVGDQGGVIDLVTNLCHHWISLAHDVLG